MFTRSKEIREDYFGWSIDFSYVDGRYHAINRSYEMLASEDLEQLKTRIREIEMEKAMYRNLYGIR